MADIVWSDVEDFASELADDAVSAGAQATILAYVNGAFSPDAFKNEATLKLARILLAAHVATMSAVSGGDMAAGPVLSEGAGGLTRSYADLVSGSTTGFSGSSYGDQLAYLMRTSKARRPFVARLRGC